MQCRLAFAAILALAASPALAQDPPNMVGNWKGEAEAVIIGPTPYRVPDGPGPNFPAAKITYTYTIDAQHGARFSGTMTGGVFSETIIGALKPPAYASGIIIDTDGRNDFTLREGGTIMDLCYAHNYPTTRAVACFTLTKQ
jgi:hypothetical protein